MNKYKQVLKGCNYKSIYCQKWKKLYRIYELYLSYHIIGSSYHLMSHLDHCRFSYRPARLWVSGRKIASWWGTSWRLTFWEARRLIWQPLSGSLDWTALGHSSAIRTSRWPQSLSFLGSSHCVSRPAPTSMISTATVVTAADPC